MKKSEIPQEILSAGPLFIGEYRGSLVELIQWVDKTDGKAKDFVKAVHLFEVVIAGAVQPIRVEERVPPAITDPAAVKVPYKRGHSYLVSLNQLRNERGNLDARLSVGSVPVELS